MSDYLTTPATKGDLQDLKIELLDAIRQGDQALKDELLAAIREGDQALKGELVEAFRDGQTEMLKAFYGFMHTIQNRFQEQDETEAALKRRMTGLESRLLEIEKRLNMPPAA